MVTVNTPEEMKDKYVAAATALLNASFAERTTVIPGRDYVRIRMNNSNIISNDIIRAAVDLADSTGGTVTIERVSWHTVLVVSHGVE